MKTIRLKFKDKEYKIKSYTIDTNSNYNLSAALFDGKSVLNGTIFKEGTTNDQLKEHFIGYLIQQDKGIKCETCQFYHHEPSILGGVAECLRGVKPLNTFLENPSCNQYQPTWVDKLKAQNDYYKEHLGGAIQLNK